MPAESICKGNDKLECWAVDADTESYVMYFNKEATELVAQVNEILGKAQDGISRQRPSNKPEYYGLVATRRGGTIGLSFRSSKRKDLLLSQPVYYTEVHFQGRTDQ